MILQVLTQGKSSLILHFIDNTFTEEYISTIGVDFVRVCFRFTEKIRCQKIFNDKIVKLRVVSHCVTHSQWDSPPRERFRYNNGNRYRGAHGIAVTFDLTDRVSFNNVKNWYPIIFCNKGCKKLIVMHMKMSTKC